MIWELMVLLARVLLFVISIIVFLILFGALAF